MRDQRKEAEEEVTVTCVELSDDQKKRILEEEHQRLAEEQYRAQVRQELQNRTAATNPTSPVVEPPKTPNQHDEPKHSTKTLLLILVIAGVVGLLWIGRSSMNSQSEPYAPSIFETKHTEKIGSGQFVVNAGKVFYYRIPVKDMRNIHITGHFLALGGQGNDIDVVLAEEKEFGLWMDGQQAKVYYQSGRATSGDIDVKLPALNATYYLAFNNRFSVLSAKTINADLSMSYSTVILK